MRGCNFTSIVGVTGTQPEGRKESAELPPLGDAAWFCETLLRGSEIHCEVGCPPSSESLQEKAKLPD